MNTCTLNNESKPLIYRICKRIFCQNFKVIVWRVRMQLRWTDIVFMIDEKVEILAKQCTSHLKPSDPFPLGDERGIWLLPSPGQSKWL